MIPRLPSISSSLVFRREHLTRRRTQQRPQQWAQHLIRHIRNGSVRPAEGSATTAVVGHQDRQGNLLLEKNAAVELLNILRPTVAVSRFIVFAAPALKHPEWRASVREGTYAGLEEFAQGQVFLLELHGTNHDPKLRARADLTFSLSKVPALPGSRLAIRPAPGQAC